MQADDGARCRGGACPGARCGRGGPRRTRGTTAPSSYDARSRCCSTARASPATDQAQGSPGSWSGRGPTTRRAARRCRRYLREMRPVVVATGEGLEVVRAAGLRPDVVVLDSPDRSCPRPARLARPRRRRHRASGRAARWHAAPSGSSGSAYGPWPCGPTASPADAALLLADAAGARPIVGRRAARHPRGVPRHQPRRARQRLRHPPQGRSDARRRHRRPPALLRAAPRPPRLPRAPDRPDRGRRGHRDHRTSVTSGRSTSATRSSQLLDRPPWAALVIRSRRLRRPAGRGAAGAGHRRRPRRRAAQRHRVQRRRPDPPAPAAPAPARATPTRSRPSVAARLYAGGLVAPPGGAGDPAGRRPGDRLGPDLPDQGSPAAASSGVYPVGSQLVDAEQKSLVDTLGVQLGKQLHGQVVDRPPVPTHGSASCSRSPSPPPAARRRQPSDDVIAVRQSLVAAHLLTVPTRLCRRRRRWCSW